MPNEPLISIVDDDQEFCAALRDLVESDGLQAEVFPCADQFLASEWCWRSQCLILDVRLPGLSGIELQRILRDRGFSIPTIFITAFPKEETRSRALAGGALCFHEKPFDSRQLMNCIYHALTRMCGVSEP